VANDPKAEEAAAAESAEGQPKSETAKPKRSRARKPRAGSKSRASSSSAKSEGTAKRTRSKAASSRRPASGGRKAASASATPSRVRPRLEQRYLDEVVPVLAREFGYTNPMQAPRVEKVVLNIGLGEALTNSNAIDAATSDLATIAGQRPVITRARKSIANFKLRDGNRIGVMVTLRGDRRWEFLDRLMNAALPRVRDFHGVPRNSFDGRGNYTLGLNEQVMFPEIDYNRVDRLRGLQLTVVTTARTDEEARRLLDLLGMPFVRATELAAAG